MSLFYLLSNLISNQPITHLSSRLQHIQKPIKGNQVSSTVNIYTYKQYIYIFQCFPPVHTRPPLFVFIFFAFLSLPQTIAFLLHFKKPVNPIFSSHHYAQEQYTYYYYFYHYFTLTEIGKPYFYFSNLLPQGTLLLIIYMYINYNTLPVSKSHDSFFFFLFSSKNLKFSNFQNFSISNNKSTYNLEFSIF